MAFGKNKPLRPIDQHLRGTASADVSDVVVLTDTPDAAPAPRAPWGLAATTGLDYSDRTAVAYAELTWNPPTGSDPSSYELHLAPTDEFINITSYAVPRPELGDDPAYTVRALKAATTYYARVRAKNYEVYTPWSSTIALTTPADDVVPSSVIDAAASFGADGTLIVTATTPADLNFAGVEIKIKGGAGGPTYTTQRVGIQPSSPLRWLWPAEDNVRLSGGGDASLTIEIRSGNWSNYYEASGVALTATKAPPSTPTVTTAWDSQSGELSFVFSEASFTTATLTIDGVARVTGSPYTYSAAQNAYEHSGTADPSVAWSVVATDALGQPSSAAAGTATLPRPADVSGATATWTRRSGTATFTWDAVAGVSRYRLTIDGVARTVADVRYDYSASLNRVEHSGTADNSLSWSIVALDGLGQTSVTPASGTATLAPPATPGSITTDFAATNAVWKWAAVLDCDYILTIDGVARTLTAPSYDYSFALNAAEHSGTADPALTWSLSATDGLGQISATPASGTLTNLPPAAPTGVTLTPGATGFIVSIAHAPVLDDPTYVARIIRNGTTVETLERRVDSFAYMAAGSGTYTVGVKIRDAFSQESSEYVTPTGTTVDVLTTAEIRADCIYSDSSGTAPATLAALKDDSATPVVTYASGTTWKWTKATRATAYRVGNIVLIASAGVGYVGISDDDTTYTYFSGPLASDGQTMTAYASEAAAQGAALALPTTKALWSLPSVASVRYIKLFHRNTSASYSLAEFYPPTLIVADAIRAGTFRGFYFSGDQMVTNQLSAITSYLGSVDISGWCTIGSAGGIWQGSAGTGPSPVTGFRLYQSATGKGLWESWNVVKQVYLGDDMALYAAAGGLKLDAAGMTIAAETADLGAGTRDAITWQYQGYRTGFLRTYVADYATPASGALYYSRIVKLLASGPPDPRSLANPYETTVGAFSGTNYATGTNSGSGVTQAAVFNASVVPANSGHSSSVAASIDVRYTTSGGATIFNQLNVYPDKIFTPKGFETSSYIEAGQGSSGTYKPIRMGQHPDWPVDTMAGLWLKGVSTYLLASDGTNLTLCSPSGYISLGVDDQLYDAFRATASATYINTIDPNGTIQLKVGNALKAFADKDGHFTAVGRFYPGNQSTYYFFYAAGFTGLQVNNDFKAVGDIYLGTRSTYLSSWLDQAVTTAATPTFVRLTLAAGTLGTSSANSLSIAGLSGIAGANNVALRTYLYRMSAGSDWTTAALITQRTTDATGQAYLAYVGNNIGFNTTAAFGGGQGVLGMANASTIPTSNPTLGGIIYVESGALKYRGSSGTITTLAAA